MLRSYVDLRVWQESYGLSLDVYRQTRTFPSDERYGLTSQLRRAAVSIPSNIAEGYGRRTSGEYIQSLHVAYGSVCELQTQLRLASDLGYLKQDESRALMERTGSVERMLKALIAAIGNKRTASRGSVSSPEPQNPGTLEPGRAETSKPRRKTRGT
jgi:four helix bundle protein